MTLEVTVCHGIIHILSKIVLVLEIYYHSLSWYCKVVSSNLSFLEVILSLHGTGRFFNKPFTDSFSLHLYFQQLIKSSIKKFGWLNSSPGPLVIGINHSANCATTTTPKLFYFTYICLCFDVNTILLKMPMARFEP